MPVCIGGMHRSGTSMVTRMLNLCGVYLGPEEDLLPPGADNPKGYWEVSEIKNINDDILERFGGAWNQPPANLPSDWGNVPDLGPLRQRAVSIINNLSQNALWGWKDPRTSLTFSFWRGLTGEQDLKVVLCLRNPLDVAKSLRARKDKVSYEHHVWYSYNQSLLTQAAGLPLIVTHYDSYFENPEAELRRVTDFLGLEVSAETIEGACAWIARDLRNQTSGLVDLVESDVPFEVIELYLELCEQSGPIYSAIFEREKEKLAGLNLELPLNAEQQRDILAMRLFKLQKDFKKASQYSETTITACREHIAKLEEQVRQQHTNFESAAGRVQELEEQLRQQFNSSTGRVQELEEQLRQQHARFEEQVRQQHTNFEAAVARIGELEQGLKDSQQAIQAQKEYITKLEAPARQLGEKQFELDSLNKRYSMLSSDLEKSEEKNRALTTQNAQLRAFLQQEQSNVKRTVADLRALQSTRTVRMSRLVGSLVRKVKK